MRTLWLRPRLLDEMIMVPRQHEKLSGIVRYHGMECRMNGFGLCKRDYNVIDRRANGLERCVLDTFFCLGWFGPYRRLWPHNAIHFSEVH